MRRARLTEWSDLCSAVGHVEIDDALGEVEAALRDREAARVRLVAQMFAGAHQWLIVIFELDRRFDEALLSAKNFRELDAMVRRDATNEIEIAKVRLLVYAIGPAICSMHQGVRKARGDLEATVHSMNKVDAIVRGMADAAKCMLHPLVLSI